MGKCYELAITQVKAKYLLEFIASIDKGIPFVPLGRDKKGTEVLVCRT